MTSINTNINPGADQNYVPPGQSQVLTNTPDTQTVQPGAGGGGATQVVDRDVLIQNVPPGLQGTTPGSTTAQEITPNAPLLVPGTILTGQDPAQFANSIISKLFSFFTTPQAQQEDEMIPLPPGPDDAPFIGNAASTDAPNARDLNSTVTDASSTNASTTTGAASTSLQAALTDDQVATLTNLNSTASSDVFKQLCLLAGVDPASSSPAAAALQDLAGKIAEKNTSGKGLSGLDATDASAISTALQTLYSGGDQTILAALQTISNNLAPMNANLQKDLNSTDADVIARGLQTMVNTLGLTPPPSAQTAGGLAAALAMLAKAMAFMNELRAEVETLEGKFTELQAQAKLAQLKDMTTNAMAGYQKGLQDIAKHTEEMHSQLAQQRLMKILGPLLAVFIAIVTVVTTVLTGGADTALGVALMVTVIALSALSIADSAGDVMNKMCDSLHITNEVMRAFLKMAVMVAVVLCTAGVAAPVAAANIAAETGVQMAVQFTMELSKATIIGMVGVGLTCLFQSGFLTASFKQLLESCGLPEDKASLGAMIMTLIVMLAALLGTLGASFAEAGNVAGEATKDIVSQADEGTIALKDVGSQTTAEVEASSGLGEGEMVVAPEISLEPVGTMAEEVVDQSDLAKKIMNMADNLKDKFKDPANLLKFMQMVSAMLQVSVNIETGVTNIKQGELAQQRAELEKDISKIQAMLAYLQSLLPTFDISIQKISESMKGYGQEVTEMVQFFSDFLQSLSQSVSKATNV